MWKRTKVSKILLWERAFGIHTGLNKAKRQFLSHSPPSNVFYSQVNYTSVPRILPVHEVDAARLIHLAAPEAHWLLLGRRDRSEPKKAEVPIYESRVAASPPPSPVAGDTRLAFRVRFIISISWLSFTQVFYFSLFFLNSSFLFYFRSSAFTLSFHAVLTLFCRWSNSSDRC